MLLKNLSAGEKLVNGTRGVVVGFVQLAPEPPPQDEDQFGPAEPRPPHAASHAAPHAASHAASYAASQGASQGVGLPGQPGHGPPQGPGSEPAAGWQPPESQWHPVVDFDVGHPHGVPYRMTVARATWQMEQERDSHRHATAT